MILPTKKSYVGTVTLVVVFYALYTVLYAPNDQGVSREDDKVLSPSFAEERESQSVVEAKEEEETQVPESNLQEAAYRNVRPVEPVTSKQSESPVVEKVIEGDTPAQAEPSEGQQKVSQELPDEAFREQGIAGAYSDIGIDVPAYEVSNLDDRLVDQLIDGGHLKPGVIWSDQAGKDKYLVFEGGDRVKAGNPRLVTRFKRELPGYSLRFLEFPIPVHEISARQLVGDKPMIGGFFASKILDDIVLKGQMEAAAARGVGLADLIKTTGPLELSSFPQFVVENMEFKSDVQPTSKIGP